MVKNTAGKGKKLPAAPLAASNKVKKVAKSVLFEKTPKNFRIGGDILPARRDLSRFVKWPRYIRMQRHKRVLLQRLKVPPALNQFNHTIDKSQAAALIKMMSKYMPETRVEKKARLLEEAEKKADDEHRKGSKKPVVVKYGLNHVTSLVEGKLAKLVVIAHDVEPLELVCWLPALCRKKEVPYCIMKSKARLGKLVHKKTATCVALNAVRKEDKNEFDMLCKNFMAKFNDNVDIRRRWGGGQVGLKSQHVQEKKQRAIEQELAKKHGMIQ